MPIPPEGTPWWAWLLYGVVVIGLPAIAVALIQQRHKVDEIQEQVKNNHESNLRVDVDEAKASAANAHTEASLAKESAHRVERLARDLIITMRAVEHAIDRRDKLHAEAMTELREDVDKTTVGLHEHLDDVPRILDEAFARHAGDCPIRQDPPQQQQ